MAITYTRERVSALDVVIPLPWPTMIPDRIGIRGKTHGVSARARPKPKKMAVISQ